MASDRVDHQQIQSNQGSYPHGFPTSYAGHWGVDAADSRGTVAVRFEMTQITGQGCWTGTGKAIIAVVMAILSGKNTHPTGRADRILRVTIAEAYPVTSQPVQMRGNHLNIPATPQDVRLMLISNDMEHVQWCCHLKIPSSLPWQLKI